MLKFSFRRKAAPTIAAPLHEQAARMLETGLDRLDRRAAYLEGQIALHQAELDKTLDMRGRYSGAICERSTGKAAPIATAPATAHRHTIGPATVKQNGIAIDEDGTYRMTQQDAGPPSIGQLATSIVDGVAEAMAGPLLHSEPRHFNPLGIAGPSLVRK